MWSSFAANTQPMITTHPSHQLLTHAQDRSMPFVVQPYQHLVSSSQNYSRKTTIQNLTEHISTFSVDIGVRVRVVVFNATFNNISVISWR